MDTRTQREEPASRPVPPARPRLVLASASPARRGTLAAAGIDTTVMVSGVDEGAVHASSAETLCLVLARLKANAVADRLRHSAPAARNSPVPQSAPVPPEPVAVGTAPAAGANRDRTGPAGSTVAAGGGGEPAAGLDCSAGGAEADPLVIGCDSVLFFEGEVLGKPADAAEAIRRWQQMRGRSGVLYTGHCLVRVCTGQQVEAVSATTVHFAQVTDSEIAGYVSTGEPLRVAGAFTIDGLGAAFVERIDGDHGTVVGISMPLLRRLLADLGVPITALWRAPSVDRTE